MIRIAVCDDHIKICSEIENLCEKTCNELGYLCEVQPYTSCESFYEDLCNGQVYDLIFLDVEFYENIYIKKEKMNGIDFSRLIRNTLKNYRVEIVFISRNVERMKDMFEVNPLDFLQKPITHENIKHIINKYILKSEIRTSTFTYYINRVPETIDLRDIIYFMSDKRKIHILLRNNDHIIFNGILDNVYEENLKKAGFYRIHKSYAVNYRYVQIYKNDRFILTTGEDLPISKEHRKQVKEQQIELREKGIL